MTLSTEVEARMDRLEIDKSLKLREDIRYLWSHGYVTVFSCTGHYYYRPATETGISGVPPEIIGTQIPYITYVANVGDGTWEHCEGHRRRWHLDDRGIFRPDSFHDKKRYEHLKRQFGSKIPVYRWISDKPLE